MVMYYIDCYTLEDTSESNDYDDEWEEEEEEEELNEVAMATNTTTDSDRYTTVLKCITESQLPLKVWTLPLLPRPHT